MKAKLLIATIILSLILCGCEAVEKHTEVCKIQSIEKQVETSGDKDSFSTYIYWMVTTDKGTYHVVTEGLWACPEAVGKLKVDSTYRLTVDGWFQSRFLGAYPYIVNVEEI